MSAKKLHSNEMEVKFDYSEIDDDYDIYQVTTSDKYISGGASFLDIDDIKVTALSFESGKSFYVMFTKDTVSRFELTKILNSKEKGDSLSIKVVESAYIPEYVLLQLFMNALTTPKDDMVSFNNLSGKLLCFRPVWLERNKDGFIKGMQCVEIKVSSDMCVSMVAHKMTALALKSQMKFGKRKLKDYPQYEFSYNNNTLKRVLEEDKDRKENFIIKPVDGERGNVTFFDFSDYATFSCTKIGLLYDILKTIRCEFGKYLTVNTKQYDVDEVLQCKRKTLEEYKAIVEEEIKNIGINFVDMVESETSGDYLQDLADEISGLIPKAKCGLGKKLSKNKLNIRYIHDKGFYTGEDPHNEDTGECVVQHITVENFNLNSKAAINNILKEMVIKHDIKEGKISLVDWSKYGYSADWIFGIVVVNKYYFMTIHPDGTFEIAEMERNIFNFTEYDKYIDYFVSTSNANSDNKKVIGLIKDSDGNINLIMDTNMFSLPDYDQIGEILENVAEDVAISGKELKVYLEGVIHNSDNKKVCEELSIVTTKLDMDKVYKKQDVLNMIKGMTVKKEVVKYIYDNTGIRLYAYLRGEEMRNEYLSGNIDVNLINIDENTARYSVGEIGNGMKYTLERASLIREIQAPDGSELFFEKMLPLMGVEFVRYGMLTVMPFPFKYLREWGR